jgi:hypothetical protein
VQGDADKPHAGTEVAVPPQDVHGFGKLSDAEGSSGRMLVSSVWATAADRDASNAGVTALRQQAVEIAQAKEVRVSTYESVFAEVSAAAQAPSTVAFA